MDVSSFLVFNDSAEIANVDFAFSTSSLSTPVFDVLEDNPITTLKVRLAKNSIRPFFAYFVFFVLFRLVRFNLNIRTKFEIVNTNLRAACKIYFY